MVTIFYMYFLMTTGLGFANVQIVYLLRDDDYFLVGDEQLGRVMSTYLMATLTASAISTIFAGYIYDLCGRRGPIFTAGILLALLIVVCPFTSPSVLLLIVVRTLSAIPTMMLATHPLIMDYVKKDSRAKASALQAFGALSGEAFAMVALFGYAK